MTGKERYEARRQQEHDNEMARLKMQEANYVNLTEAKETEALVIRALRAFLTGEAALSIEPGNQEGSMAVRFMLPADLKPKA